MTTADKSQPEHIFNQVVIRLCNLYKMGSNESEIHMCYKSGEETENTHRQHGPRRKGGHPAN
jgi:hypothetical protein